MARTLYEKKANKVFARECRIDDFDTKKMNFTFKLKIRIFSFFISTLVSKTTIHLISNFESFLGAVLATFEKRISVKFLMVNCKSLRENFLDRFYLDGLYVDRNCGCTLGDRRLGVGWDGVQLGLHLCCRLFVDRSGNFSLVATTLVSALQISLASSHKKAADLNKLFLSKKDRICCIFVHEFLSFLMQFVNSKR